MFVLEILSPFCFEVFENQIYYVIFFLKLKIPAHFPVPENWNIFSLPKLFIY